MTTKQKCEKLAKVLDTVASKLREDIGQQVWEKEEPAMQSLIAQVHIFLKKAMDISTKNTKPASRKSKKSRNTDNSEDKDSQILNDWPDILL